MSSRTFCSGTTAGSARITGFLENGILDSTGVLELVGFLEEKFGIRVEDDELVPDNMNSLEKITLYISKKTSKIQPA